MDNSEESGLDITLSVPGKEERLGIANIHLRSTEHSCAVVTPSITSATSAGNSDTDEVMSDEWCEGRDHVQPLEFLVDQIFHEGPSNRSLNGDDDDDDDDSHTMPQNASTVLGKSSDDDGSFHSVLYSNWETATDEISDHDYASDCTDGSADSFGPLRRKYRREAFGTPDRHGNFTIDQPGFHNGAKLRNVRRISRKKTFKVGHDESHVDSSPYINSQQMNRDGEGIMLYSSLSISCSSDSDKLNHVDLFQHSPCNKTKSRRLYSASIPEPPHSPIPLYIQRKSRQARAAIKKRREQARSAFLKHKEAYRSYRLRRRAARQQRLLLQQQQKSRIIVIPSNHKLKILWDMATIGLTFVSAYVGHIYIRDRSTYEWDWFVIFTNIWFFIDLLLNFFTEHRTSDGTVMKTGREVWGRYLTTWFAIDALSLLPWERMFLRPIIQKQKRRNFVVKWFFRSKAVVKVTRILKGRHVKAFGRVASNTKKVGIGGKRLLQLIIKYVPKYILFYRNMKGVLVLKILRQIHFLKKVFRGLKSTTNLKQEENSFDTLDYDDLSELDSKESDDFEDDGDEAEEENDDDDDNDDLSHRTLMETDYESCFDDEDGGRIRNFNSSHCVPTIRRTVRVSSGEYNIYNTSSHL
mmetsp:Transcript_15222/g.28643  ORF Transcript_15222/g.28643 Transcript_15222/m.28643 type:complete len:636 (-) Transcript_15222:104-2011(-)